MSNRNVWPDWPLILAYHSVSEHRNDGLAVRPEDFEFQMSWLYNRGYRSTTLADMTDRKMSRGERLVVISFDDGYADNFTSAFPVLTRFGFVATVFLVSDYVNTDRVFPWDALKVGTETSKRLYRVLDWDQVGEMASYGIEFGSHTCSHPRLTEIPTKQRWDEITRSRSNLKAKLGRDIISFCYPRGDLNPDVIRMVEKAGYRTAVVTPPRRGIPLTKYTLRRVGVYRHTRSIAFRLKAKPIIRRLYYESLV